MNIPRRDPNCKGPEDPYNKPSFFVRHPKRKIWNPKVYPHFHSSK